MANDTTELKWLFPSARSSGEYRKLSEKNITGIIRNILDNKGTFVIDIEDTGSIDGTLKKTTKLYIQGYFFEINFELSVTEDDDSVFADITIIKEDELNGQLEGETVVEPVITVSAEKKSPESNHSIQILEKDANNNWVVPKTSHRKYEASRIFQNDGEKMIIDGGLVKNPMTSQN